MAAVLGLMGCSSPSSSGDPVTYTVTFDAQGGTPTPEVQTVTRDGKATAPPAPTKPGYVLEGWYTEAAYTTKWVFNSDTVTAATTLYAKWRATTAGDLQDQNKEALKDAGEIILTAKDTGGADVELVVTVGEDSITIVIDGETTANYPSEIRGDAIVLEGAGSGGSDVSLGYVINNDGTLTITSGLDQIAGADLAPGQVTSEKNDDLKKPDISFLVSFEAQGGAPTPPAQTVAGGGKVTRPADPTTPPAPGYTFAGWHKEVQGTNVWNFDVDTVTAPITLYAKWTAGTSFTVSFDAQGGAPTPNPQPVTSGGKAVWPSPVPAKDRYDLEGWYTEAAYTTKWDFNNAVTANITLYAKWTEVAPDSFVVSFDSGSGGSPVQSQNITSGGKATIPTPAPTKADHTFDAWYADEGYVTVYNFDTPVTANITLYAKWTAIVRHAVTFNAQGGEPTPTTQNVVSGAKATGPSPVPLKEGYTLEGWYKEAAYTTKWNFDTDTVTAAITLYAKWTEVEPDSFVVTFDSAGGSEVADQNVTSGGKATVPTPPTKADHTFGGWYTEATHITAWDFNNPVTANIILYAKWAAIEISSYNVAFNAQGGEPTPTTQNVVSGEKAAAPSPVPLKDGYTIEGWYMEETYATKWDFELNTVTAHITLHAKWAAVEPDMFVVTFDSAGGSEVADQIVTSGGKALRPAPDPARNYHSFGGWHTGTAENAAPYDFDTPVTASITLYAKWTLTFVSVSGIASSIPASATTNDDIDLNAAVIVNPGNATNKTIVWTLKGDTPTGVTNSDLGGVFRAPNGGILNLIATIANGKLVGGIEEDFVKDDISITIVKPVTNITGVSLNGTRGVAINLGGATVVPGDASASHTEIVWSVTESTVAGIAVGSAPPFMPAGTGTVKLLATIANGEAMGEAYEQEITITIHNPGQYNPEVGFGDETFLSVKDSKTNKIQSGAPETQLDLGAPYYITLESSSQYDGIAWYINGTKSAVTGSRLTLDTTRTGPVQVTVEAYKDGDFNTGTFRFRVQ
jgi:uncharacterized repeat protein (TIGR02543 family)